MNTNRINLLRSLGLMCAKRSQREGKTVKRAIEMAICEYADTHKGLPQPHEMICVEREIYAYFYKAAMAKLER